MSYEEMLRICSVLVKAGIDKIRITGGEPFVRKDIMFFLEELSSMNGLNQISITTNGVLTAPLVPQLKKLGIHSVNLSLDTLDRNRFFAITHRDEFSRVKETLDQLLLHEIDTKINAVVMQGKNIEDLIPLANLTRDLPVSVRFIEEMPFNGAGSHYTTLEWNYTKILDTLKRYFPSIQKIPDPKFSTSYNYQVPGHQGTIGIIAAFSRTFCGTCNRIRITPQGVLKTCLYDDGVLNLKDLMRKGSDDQQLTTALTGALGRRAKDGMEAERRRQTGLPVHESMATIGG
jgi:cyclic pyranopterin phosphate synthase